MYYAYLSEFKGEEAYNKKMKLDINNGKK